MAWYLDTSAFVKLCVSEQRSTEMRAWADAEEERSGSLWSSELLLTEAVRVARRVSTEVLKATLDRLQRISIIAITTDTYVRAGELDPAILRSLDAVHLAAALTLGGDLEGIVTYDGRLAEAAGVLGLQTEAP
jgi:uncharacterized protein